MNMAIVCYCPRCDYFVKTADPGVCDRCRGTGEWLFCEFNDYCDEDDCHALGCPDCGVGLPADHRVTPP